MDDRDYDRKLDELDRLLNDPDRRMDPDKVWDILAEISPPDEPAARHTPDASPG